MHVAIGNQPGEDRATEQDVEVCGRIGRKRAQAPRHALDGAIIFCRSRKVQDRAEVLHRQTTVVLGTAPDPGVHVDGDGAGVFASEAEGFEEALARRRRGDAQLSQIVAIAVEGCAGAWFWTISSVRSRVRWLRRPLMNRRPSGAGASRTALADER